MSGILSLYALCWSQAWQTSVSSIRSVIRESISSMRTVDLSAVHHLRYTQQADEQDRQLSFAPCVPLLQLLLLLLLVWADLLLDYVVGSCVVSYTRHLVSS